MIRKAKLEPCPYCKLRFDFEMYPLLFSNQEEKKITGLDAWYYWCPTCESYTGSFPTISEADKAWNSRKIKRVETEEEMEEEEHASPILPCKDCIAKYGRAPVPSKIPSLDRDGEYFICCPSCGTFSETSKNPIPAWNKKQEIELHKCICGSVEEPTVFVSFSSTQQGVLYYECSCGLRTKDCTSLVAAKLAWNRLFVEYDLREENKQLRKDLSDFKAKMIDIETYVAQTITALYPLISSRVCPLSATDKCASFSALNEILKELRKIKEGM